MAIAGGPEAGLLGSAWVTVLRALSQLDLLQAVLTRRALDKKAAEVRKASLPPDAICRSMHTRCLQDQQRSHRRGAKCPFSTIAALVAC